MVGKGLIGVTAAGALLVLSATQAFAHAKFPDAGSYPSGSDQRLVLEVPEERDETTHSVGVKVELPTDWRAIGCEATAPWTCGVSSSGDHPVVEWTRDASAPPGASDETFAFSVHTGAPGQVAIPVNQTYSTGEIVHWTGPHAPVLEVVAAPAPSTTTTAPPPSTTTVGSTTSSPKSTAAPVTTVTDDTATLVSIDESGDSGGTPAWAIALPAAGVVAAGGLGYRIRGSRRQK